MMSKDFLPLMVKKNFFPAVLLRNSKVFLSSSSVISFSFSDESIGVANIGVSKNFTILNAVLLSAKHDVAIANEANMVMIFILFVERQEESRLSVASLAWLALKFQSVSMAKATQLANLSSTFKWYAVDSIPIWKKKFSEMPIPYARPRIPIHFIILFLVRLLKKVETSGIVAAARNKIASAETRAG
jgi:hypothetical protein